MPIGRDCISLGALCVDGEWVSGVLFVDLIGKPALRFIDVGMHFVASDRL